MEVVLDDGRVVRSDRFVVAICACRRSRSTRGATPVIVGAPPLPQPARVRRRPRRGGCAGAPEPVGQPRHVRLADPEGVACLRLRHLLTNRICSGHRSRWPRPAMTGRRARRSPRLRLRGRWHRRRPRRPRYPRRRDRGRCPASRGVTVDGHTPEEGLRQLPGIPRPDLLRLLERAQPVLGGAREVRLRVRCPPYRPDERRHVPPPFLVRLCSRTPSGYPVRPVRTGPQARWSATFPALAGFSASSPRAHNSRTTRDSTSLSSSPRSHHASGPGRAWASTYDTSRGRGTRTACSRRLLAHYRDIGTETASLMRHPGDRAGTLSPR